MLDPTSGIALGGYAQPVFDPSYAPIAEGSAAWKRYNLVDLAAHHAPPVALWMLTSKKDTLSYPTSSKLITAARAPMSLTPTVLDTGAHRAEVWIPYIEPSLSWLAATSHGFSAKHTTT
ncbi:MAG: hypothetical protein Q4G43_02295 [Mobilicoccus sp.]|nr:hypothetical protein [Mobilicoccus sp.]